MTVDYLLFGAGHDGSVRTKEEYIPSVARFLPASAPQISGSSVHNRPTITNPALGVMLDFDIVEYTYNNKTYLLAFNGPQDGYEIDMRILTRQPRPFKD